MVGRGAGWGGAGGTGEGCSDALEADGAADYDGFESAHKQKRNEYIVPWTDPITKTHGWSIGQEPVVGTIIL